ncbi:hypothetical protein [Haloferula sp. BvORR071]|uniref:hypothetical protein n=1 Tax=Haloferula sp. BvORR071 TaxID=1396141 RepID=UPI000558402D|nr:hypothetical protein [Haloferula sp. BvORR071]
MKIHSILAAVSILCFPSCRTTTKLPICPGLARYSYATLEEGKGKLVGRRLEDAMAQRGIGFTPLSNFTAQFEGYPWDLQWLRENYVDFLTDFNPRHVITDRETYLEARRNAPHWINLIDTNRSEELLDIQNGYCAACCDTPEFRFRLRNSDAAD